MTKIIYTWDLGATKCTAGLVEYHSETRDLTCIKKHTVKLKEVSSLEKLITNIEETLGLSMAQADSICIGAAGHYDGQFLLLDNAYPFPMHFAKIAELHGWKSYAVIHDYAPIVCATFTSYIEQPNNIKRLNPYEMKNTGRRVALGIGTGLGLKDGVLLDNGDFWLGRNEIGHIGVTSPPLADKIHLQRHEELIRFLQEKTRLQANQPLTFEKILSGSGTARLYQFFYGDEEISPEEVGEKMRQGIAPEMLDAFAWYAGLFVGTVQLTFMPEGGVWITGGVSLNHLDVFERPDFFSGINASPAYRLQRDEYPLSIMCNHEHALIGCGYYATKRLMKG
ncbi:MAG: glucokinase [Gammaproteobacteria bacterium]|nr:glucokinase [Gammaproteobacteria bacterium]